METAHALPPVWLVAPFGLLLGLIALAPLFFAHWWHKHYPKVAIALAAVVLAYYLGVMKATAPVAHVAHEYFSFIALIGSLYIVAGGIHITVKGEGKPWGNVVFLLVGAVIANVIGTTGASMLLIRPWIRVNKYRITAHHIVFFIFIVSNVGGCLTPIGDPPLFLGYLRGVPFWWVAEHCLPMWAVGVGCLLLMFYFVDRANFLKAPKRIREDMTDPAELWSFQGKSNLIFLAVILGAVFVNNPVFLREGLMIGAAVGSWFTTKKHIHLANKFSWAPVKEVAILFIGIFATMLPALDWLQDSAKGLANVTPGFFYWSCGTLSSLLDNAPTYYSFLTAIFGVFVDADTVAQVQGLIQTHGAGLSTLVGAHADDVRQTYAALQKYHGALLESGQVSKDQIEMAFLLGSAKLNLFLTAISVSSVFFGAITYIGNGPNFMVKSIAEEAKVHTPSFLGYVGKYSLPFMVPMVFLVWWLFFRG